MALTRDEVKIKLKDMHEKLILSGGNFNKEMPEQIMSAMYLKGHEKVLELGGNIGRNSLIIASLLNDSSNLVTLESDEHIAKRLNKNRKINNLNFHVESSALSSKKLIQKGWYTRPSETLQPGYHWINTISYEELKQKYSIDFDTLVLDCEGAIYWILKDTPEILDNVNLIIIENDFQQKHHKQYFDETLKNNNFYVDYTEAGPKRALNGSCFYQVWKKAISPSNG